MSTPPTSTRAPTPDEGHKVVVESMAEAVDTLFTTHCYSTCDFTSTTATYTETKLTSRTLPIMSVQQCNEVFFAFLDLRAGGTRR